MDPGQWWIPPHGVIQDTIDRGGTIGDSDDSHPWGHTKSQGDTPRRGDHPLECTSHQRTLHPSFEREPIFSMYGICSKRSQNYYEKWFVSSHEGWESCVEHEEAKRGVPDDGNVGNGVGETRH